MKNLIKYVLLIVAVGLMITVAQAQQTYPSTNRVSLAWDPSPSPGITNYAIYYGPSSRNYTNSVNVGNTLNCTLTNLSALTTYYFAATAQDNNGLESDFSNEVSYTVPRPKPVPPGQLRKTAP